MGEVAAWKDLKAEADEYYLAAEKAAKAGNYDEAKRLIDDAKNKYKELNGAVEENGRVLISEEEARKAAMAGVRESGELKIKLINEQIEAEKKAAQLLNEQTGGELAKKLPEVAKQFGEISIKAKDLTESAAEFNEAWNNAWDRATIGGHEAIVQLEKELKELTRDRSIKFYLEEIPPDKKANGGQVQGYASGGFHPGGFRIVGERGPELEYTGPSRIFNSSSTGAILSRLSSLVNISAAGFSSRNASTPAAGNSYSISLNYSGGGSKSDAKMMTDMLMTELQRRNRRSSR